jgi:copper chaperone CopZ
MTAVIVQPDQSGLQVVHAMRGRVRLRAVESNLATGDIYSDRWQTVAQRLSEEEGVCNVQASLETGSLVVTFDENALSYTQMFAILRRCGVAIGQELPSQENQADSFWINSTQIESIIPLIAGALITGGLGIGGLPAIPIYLLAAGTTRQLMEQWEEEGDLPSPAIASNHRTISEVHATASQKIACSVIHAVPGRVRFQVPKLAEDEVYGRRLEKIVQADSQITSVRVNPAAASVVFTYDPNVISDGEMRSHLVHLIQQAGEVFAPIYTPKADSLAAKHSSKAAQEKVKSTVCVSTYHLAEGVVSKPKKITFLTGFKPPALSLILNFMAHCF